MSDEVREVRWAYAELKRMRNREAEANCVEAAQFTGFIYGGAEYPDACKTAIISGGRQVAALMSPGDDARLFVPVWTYVSDTAIPPGSMYTVRGGLLVTLLDRAILGWNEGEWPRPVHYAAAIPYAAVRQVSHQGAVLTIVTSRRIWTVEVKEVFRESVVQGVENSFLGKGVISPVDLAVVPWVMELQGWARAEFHRHAEGSEQREHYYGVYLATLLPLEHSPKVTRAGIEQRLSTPQAKTGYVEAEKWIDKLDRSGDVRSSYDELLWHDPSTPDSR